jgi:uncharacterized protein YggL (DUF469 family)
MTNNNENEEVIATNIGYPYNTIPKGYPNKISTEKIEETIDKVLDNLKANAGVETIVNRDAVFINLGLNEIGNRNNKKQSRIALWLSVLAVILAALALL